MRTDYTKTIPHWYSRPTIPILFVVLILSLCFTLAADMSTQTQSLAEKVFDRYRTFLQREDIEELLPTVFEEIKKPENQQLLVPVTINLVADNPDLLKTFVPGIEEAFITLLKEDQEIQTFIRDEDVQTLLQDPEAITELESLLAMSKIPIANRVFERYQTVFQRQDIKNIIPNVLSVFKNPENQNLLQPDTFDVVLDNPDKLKELFPQIDDAFITLLKDDSEVRTLINDYNVQQLLCDPSAIDDFAILLNITVIVRIVPASVESPEIGEHLVVTVDIANGFGVYGYMGTIGFDNTALRSVSLEHGTYLSGELLPIETMIDDDSIDIDFAQISIDTSAATSDGTLVTITFEVIEVKASMLSLSEVIISGFAGFKHPVMIENAEITEPPRTPWDVNGDGRVNILDLTFVASYFGADTFPPQADVNSDGKVNILDLTTVAGHFGETV